MRCDYLTRILWKPSVSTDEVKQLLDAMCCDVNQSNSSGMTPLKSAVMNADEPLVELLLNHGATVTDEVIRFARAKYPHKTGVGCLLDKRKLIESIGGEELPSGTCPKI